MSQIVYQEAFDPYHAAFRILRLRSIAPTGPALATDHVRVLDFYLVFPFRLKAFKFKQPHVRFRKMLKSYDDARPYGSLPDDRILMDRMRPMQMAALATLARRDLIDRAALASDKIIWVDTQPDPDLAEAIAARNADHPVLGEVLSFLITEYDTTGPDGIKARSGLIEHRYDAVA